MQQGLGAFLLVVAIRSRLGRVWGRGLVDSHAAAEGGAGARDAWHIFWPSYCGPHQQRPSASMMQGPLPQQRGSSVMSRRDGAQQDRVGGRQNWQGI
jgi:hypothetical protein